MARKNKSNQVSREYLLKAFVSLMQTENYSDITVTDITTAAGVSRMAYYRNYTSKDQILTMYLDDISAAIVRPLNDYLPVPKDVAEYIVLLFKRLAADAKLYEYNLGLALHHAGLGSLFLESIVKNLRVAFPAESQKEITDISMAAGAFYGVYMQWSQEGQPDNASVFADALYEFFSKN